MMPAAYPHQDGIWVDVFQQSLQLRRAGLHRRWTVSTALAGVGEQKGSQQTPRGQFRIRAAIGSQAIEHSVWVGRRETGECYTKELAAALPGRDWILGRILWLGGTQPGFNRFGSVDTASRYIYIHGTPESEPMGLPRSHGCVRMHTPDLLELFSMVKPGEMVWIGENWSRPQVLDDIQVSACTWQAGYTHLRQLRDSVFVQELGIPAEIERDDLDASGMHFLVWNRLGQAIGCGRIMPGGWLGRMAIAKEYRNAGVGHKLLATMCAHARTSGLMVLKLHALKAVQGFYQQAGAVPIGAAFVAAGIAHQEMHLTL